MVLQGNLDPCVLYADDDVIKREAATMMRRFGGTNQNLIANLGHGMHPTHDKERLRVYLQTVRDFAAIKDSKI